MHRYLLHYLSTLCDAEIENLQALDLSEQERTALDLLLGSCRGEAITRGEAAAKLSISGREFEVLCGGLLQKVYGIVVPGGGMWLLRHLLCRCASENFVHELRQQLDEIRREGVEATRDFIAEAIWAVHHHGSTIDADRTILDAIESEVHPEEWTDNLQLRLELARLDDEVMESIAKQETDGDAERLTDRIEAIYARLELGSDPELRHDLFQLLYTWFTHRSLDRDRSMEMIERKRALADHHPELFPTRDYEECVELADHHLTFGDVPMAIKLFNRVIGQHDQLFIRQPFYLDRAVSAFIVARDYDAALGLIVGGFGERLERASGDVARAMHLNMACVGILAGYYSVTRTHLDALQAFETTPLYVNIEVERRLLEAALAACEERYNEAEKMIDTGLGRVQTLELDITAATPFHLLRAASRQRAGDGAMSSEDRARLDAIGRYGAAGHIARVIETVAGS